MEAGPRSTLGVGLAVRQEEWGQPQAEARWAGSERQRGRGNMALVGGLHRQV